VLEFKYDIGVEENVVTQEVGISKSIVENPKVKPNVINEEAKLDAPNPIIKSMGSTNIRYLGLLNKVLL
jgi:hypothetical protein